MVLSFTYLKISIIKILVPDCSTFELDVSLLCIDHIWIKYVIQAEASIVLLIILISQVLLRKGYFSIFLFYILLLIVVHNKLQCFQFLETHDHFRPYRPCANTRNRTLWINWPFSFYYALKPPSIFTHMLPADCERDKDERATL